MNTAANYTKERKQQVNWARVLFHISKCNGKINRKFNPKTLFGKLEQEDVDIVMSLIEKEAKKFSFLRFLYKLEIIVIILSLIIFILAVIFFFIFDNDLKGFIFLFCGVLLILFYFFVVNRTISKNKKSIQKKLYPVLDHINRRLFNMRSLYIMIDQDLNYICIYIVPPFIEANVLLKNILYDSQNSEVKDKKEISNNNFTNIYNSNQDKNTQNYDLSSNKTRDILKVNEGKRGFGLL